MCLKYTARKIHDDLGNLLLRFYEILKRGNVNDRILNRTFLRKYLKVLKMLPKIASTILKKIIHCSNFLSSKIVKENFIIRVIEIRSKIQL